MKIGSRKVRLAEDTLELSNGFEVREVRGLDDRGTQVSIVTTRRDLSMPEVARRMFGRWRQENFLRYMRHEFDLDRLPTYAVEPADPDRSVRNPEHKAKEEELKSLRAELARAHQALGEAVASHAEQDQVSELRERIGELDDRVGVTREERAALSKKVPLRELMDESEIVQLERERKRITDLIKTAAYHAETELADLAGPSLGFHHQDEARRFLREVFNLRADLLPDPEAGTLTVHLYSMANPRSNRALAELCAFLNDQQRYQDYFPGTRIRLVLVPPTSQN